MRRLPGSLLPCACLLMIPALVATCGCAAWRGTEPLVDNPVVEHYRRIAERVAFPEHQFEEVRPQPSLGESRPLVAPRPEELWHLSLAEAVRLALQNNQIIRQNAQFLSPQNPVLANPDGVPSIFDASIQNFGVIFGSRGTHGALSDFDPRFTATMTAARDETGQNITSTQTGPVLAKNTDQAQMQLTQQLLSGGVFTLTHNWDYSDTNQTAQLFPSWYSGSLGAQITQPLWSGAGREVTSIAGPVTQQARGFSYVNQGVVIARINNRIAEIDVEENLQNLVREIGDVYWDLYRAHHEFESERATADVTKKMWEELHGKFQADLIGEADDAQAEDAYYEAAARQEQALSGLLQTETRLRRLLGLPITDGRFLSPIDEPVAAEIRPNRTQCLYEALTNRLELRRQKTNLHSLELQLTAARNIANPSLNLVAGYNLNGFGQNLASGGTADGRTQEGFNNAYASLFRGKETSWNVGLQYSMPLWLRGQRAQVHQLEFRIVKARLTLATQEDEIARELYTVLQTIQRWNSSVQTNHRRVLAARRRAAAVLAEHRDADRTPIDPVLRAEVSVNQATIAYYGSLSEYNKSLREMHYRMGRILPAHGIELLDCDGVQVHPPSNPMLEAVPASPAAPKRIDPPTKTPEPQFMPVPVAGGAFPPPTIMALETFRR